jgi:hypothetical protein
MVPLAAVAEVVPVTPPLEMAAAEVGMVIVLAIRVDHWVAEEVISLSVVL